MSGETVLITGAAGAIGQHLVRTMSAGGWRVVGLGHGAPLPELPWADWINGEIEASNLEALATRQTRPDCFIHLAGGSMVGPSVIAPAEDFARTAATSVRLLEWVRQKAPEAAVVLASSAAVYGDTEIQPIPEDAPRAPLSPYGTHKMMMELAGESWARNFGVRIAIVRLFSVYGPGLHKQLIWEICAKLAHGARTLTLGGTGAETRDWIHIDDAAAILASAARLASLSPPKFKGCTGIGTSEADVARAVVTGFGTDANISFSGERRLGDPTHLVGHPNLARGRAGLENAYRRARRICRDGGGGAQGARRLDAVRNGRDKYGVQLFRIGFLCFRRP